MAPIRGEAAPIVDVLWKTGTKQSAYRNLIGDGFVASVLGLLAVSVLTLLVVIQQLSPTLPEQQSTAAGEAAITERGIVRVFESTAGQPALIVRRNGTIDLKPFLADGSAATPYINLGCLPIVHRNTISGQLVFTSVRGELMWSDNLAAGGFENERGSEGAEDRILDAVALPGRSSAYTRTMTGSVEYWAIDHAAEAAGRLRRTQLPVPQSPTCIAASPSGRFLACAYAGGGWAVYDHTTGTAKVWSSPVTGMALSMAWAPDERRVLATYSEGFCALMSIEKQSFDWQKRVNPCDLLAVSIDNTGKRFAAGGVFKQLVVGDLTSGRVAHASLAHGGAISTIAFSRDAQYICTGSTDGGLRVWNAESGLLTREAF